MSMMFLWMNSIIVARLRYNYLFITSKEQELCNEYDHVSKSVFDEDLLLDIVSKNKWLFI